MSWITYSLVLIAYYALHSIMASLSIKAVFLKIGINDQIYRILFNSVALGTSAGVYLLFQSTNTSIDRFGSPLGAGLVALGLFLVVKSLIDYDLLAFIGLKKEEKYDELVTSGLNRYVRHPLYLGIIVALLGWNAVYVSGAALATLVVTFLYVQLGIYLEERKLVAQFGSQYLDYQNAVPKLMPRFWK